jgi:hypothetical protein
MKSEGVKRAREHGAELLHATKPIFEAGFSADGALPLPHDKMTRYYENERTRPGLS